MAEIHMAHRTITEHLVKKRILPRKYKNKVASMKEINDALNILYPEADIKPKEKRLEPHHLIDWCKYLNLEILQKRERFKPHPAALPPVVPVEQFKKVAPKPRKRRTKAEKEAARKSRREKRESMLSETQYAAFIEKAKQHFDYDYINSPDFLNSIAWANLRYSKLVASDNRCACCGRSVKQGAILNVDHIKPRRLFPELALESSNLQVLCSECNKGKASASVTRF